ncbi:MAG: transporter permease [Acidobacteria bacterium]|nr:transporter permease [Acidobacteriota bacterium]
MTSRRLILASLRYYWRTNAAVVLGVATAVAVLAGALLVGDSVRGSLRDLVLERLGRTDQVVLSAGLIREQLAEDLRAHPDFGALFDGICPIVLMPGFVSMQSGGGRAGQVLVYGVDDRFWRFHGIGAISGPEGREALLSPALARELGTQEGATILVRVERPSDVPLESLHGRKDDLGRTLRATVRTVLPREMLGEFSLQAQQGEIRAVFLPLALLQQDLDMGRRVNALLVSAKPESAAASATTLEQLVRSEAELEDLGLKLRVLDARRALSLEADGGVIDPIKANAALEAAREIGLQPQPIFTYLANTFRSGGREFPYSLVTAMNLPTISGESLIVLNDWAARDLRARVGDAVTMEYYVWEDPGRLAARTAEFRVAGVVPSDPRDRDLAPAYPGITESPTLGDWDPPFPIDLRRIRAADEEYWERYRTTPKAFISYEAGARLWQSRYGAMTSIRFTPDPGQPLEEVRQAYAERLRAKMDPLAMGLAVRNVRAESLAAASGATDFGEYFVYFRFFLVVSALLLAAPRGGSAAGRRVPVSGRPPVVPLGRAVAFGGGSGGGRARRDRLRASDDGRLAHLVGGGRGNDGSHPAHLRCLSRRRRVWRNCRIYGLHLGDSPESFDGFRAPPADRPTCCGHVGKRSRRPERQLGSDGRGRFCRARRPTDGRGRGGTHRAGWRLLRCRYGVAGLVSVSLSVLARAAGQECITRSGLVARRSFGTPQRDLPPVPERPVHGDDRLGHFHSDFGGRLPPRGRHRPHRPALRRWRVFASGRIAASARSRSHHPRGTRDARTGRV